jgi:hypothetical protein
MANSVFHVGGIEGQIDALNDSITTINNKIGTVPSGKTVEGQITSLNSKLFNEELFGVIEITATTTASGYITTTISPTRIIIDTKITNNCWSEHYVGGSGNWTFRVYDSNGNPLASTTVTLTIYFIRTEYMKLPT